MSDHIGDRAAAYVDGALDPTAEAKVRQHLGRCDKCQRIVEAQSGVRDLLRETSRDHEPPPAASGFLDALAAMPVAGVPKPIVDPSAGQRTVASAVRRGVVSGVAISVALMATAWAVGSETDAAPLVASPERLAAQHEATAGEIPFWGSQPSSASGAPTSGSALDTLRRGAGAAASLSYRGVEQVSPRSGTSAVQVIEVSHIPGHGTSVRSMSPDGETASFRPLSATATADGVDALALLELGYVLHPEGTEQVAGRLADRVSASTHDGVVVADFWVDHATGLVLRRELRDLEGRVVSSAAFTSVNVDDSSVMPKHLPVASSATWGEAPEGFQPAALAAQGWWCPGESIPTGTSTLTALDARLTSGPEPDVLHLVYTDGLRSLSVFEQQGRLDPRRLDGFARAEVGGRTVFKSGGTPAEATWAEADTVVTVIGDAATVDAVLTTLPAPEVVGPDPLGRAGRGLARVGSWFDPFG